VADISFADIAEHLSRICRYAGAVNVPHYSVAQHSCLTSEACDRIAPRSIAAVYGHLHDAHEYLIGDVSKVLESNLDDLAQAQIEGLRCRIDAAIHQAAGIAWPPPREVADVLAEAHARVEAAEAYCHIANVPPPKGVLPAVRAIGGWPQPKAHEMFVNRLAQIATLHGLTIETRI
jgi:5'-deoxynucleotidase YfbR-like HD superfamily hydrolase